ncbi:MAG: hypothetical protein V7696_13910 [Halioglobus sp.]
MYYVHGIINIRNIDHPIDTDGFSYTDLSDTLANALQGLPVIRISPALYFVYLKPGILPSIGRESSDLGQGIAQKYDIFD